jgi:carboxylesterase type B
MEQADYDLSGEMVSAWTNFMKSGEPGGGWEAYTEENPYIQEFS